MTDKLKKRIEELELAIKTTIEGDYPMVIGKNFNPDGSYSKHDRCIHDLPVYNGCEACVADYLVLALKADTP